LVPLGSVSLMGKDKFSLLTVGELSLILEFDVLLLEHFLLSFELSLQVIKFPVSVGLGAVTLFFESVSFIDGSFELLLQATGLGHHAFVVDFKSLVEGLVFLLESSNGVVQLVGVVDMLLTLLLKLFLELLLDLTEHKTLVVLDFLLVLVLRLLELVNSLLELLEGILIVLLGLVLLLLEEVELAFPESLLLFKLTLDIGMLSLHIVVLALPVLNLLSDSKFSL
jgi:hypothetical protein